MEPHFSTDWFSPHIPSWERILIPYFQGKTNLNMLEIGSFEGRSACWLLTNILTHPTSRLTCVDTFSTQGSAGNEHRDIFEHFPFAHSIPVDLPNLEQTFDKNIEAIGAVSRVIKMKGWSQEILRTLPLHSYGCIYIDGSHRAANVLTDIILCWDILADGGILILDDYEWTHFPDAPLKNPKAGIDAFLDIFDGQYEILLKEYQVILKKTPPSSEKAAMRIACVSWVRNECDVIEAFVRHHCAFADRMVIVCHRCADNTVEILEALQAEGLPLEILQNDGVLHTQDEILNSLIRRLATDDAMDWILPLDADEFVLHPSNSSVRAELEAADSGQALEVPWRTYVPTVHDDENEPNVLRRIRFRRTAEHPQWHKSFIPRAQALREDATLSFGNHAILDTNTGLALPAVRSINLSLAHFPIRSTKQIAVKVWGGWLSHIANPRTFPGNTFQWKALFDRLKQSDDIPMHDLTELALQYATHAQWNALPASYRAEAQRHGTTEDPTASKTLLIEDPVPRQIQLRYPAHHANPHAVLLDTAEAIALAHAVLARAQHVAP